MTNCDLTFERLEDRKLLAVSASQKGGTLNITGSNSADNVAVDGTAALPGVVVVTDLDTGVASLFIGVKTINVDTKGGIDVVAVNLNGGDAITSNLSIKTGAGLDIVAGTGLVTGNLTVDTSNGTDIVIADALLVTGTTKISTGSDEDVIALTNSAFIGNATFDTGSGQDFIVNDGNIFIGSVTAKLGSGDDFYAETNATIGGPLKVDGGAGIDEVDFTGTIVLGAVSIKKVEIP
jgi:hypothetical protein